MTDSSKLYDPSVFEEDHIIESRGILGWLGRKRLHTVERLARMALLGLKEMKILDVGCGFGEIISSFNNCSNAFLAGVDINPAAVEEAKSRINRASFAIINIEKQDLPFEREFFDLVICSEVLEHLDFPEIAVEKIIDSIKPGGHILITVPNETLTTLGRFILRKKPYKSPAHKQAFSRKSINALFSNINIMKSINIPISFFPFFISTNMAVLFKK